MIDAETLAAIPCFRGADPARLTIKPLGGLTNRNFRISDGNEDYVLRLPGPGTGRYLDRSREANNTALAADLGIAPRVQWQDPERGLMLSRYLNKARPLEPADFKDNSTLAASVAILRKLHLSGVKFQGEMSPDTTFERYVELARQQHSPHIAELRSIRREISPRCRALTRTGVAMEPAPCHVDPSPANFVVDESRLWLVDWEFAAVTDPLWDLACMSLEANLNTEQRAQALTYYCADSSAKLQSRFLDQLRAAGIVGLAWTAMQCALERTPGKFDGEYRARRERLRELLGAASEGAFATRQG